MTKIYIAGPMTGIPDYNRPAFNDYAAKLVAQGHTVLNPATLPDGLEQGEYMDICLAMVRACDELHVLPGWEDSLGASVEYDYACKIGKTVTEVEVGETCPTTTERRFVRVSSRDALRNFLHAADNEFNVCRGFNGVQGLVDYISYNTTCSFIGVINGALRSLNDPSCCTEWEGSK